MNDDPHRLRNPLHALLDEAWRAHHEHDRLKELKAERDVDGSRTWQTVWDVDEGDPEWAAAVFRPVNPFDGRAPIRVGRWPVSHLERELEEWRARCMEHDA